MRQIRVLLVDDSPEFLCAAAAFLSRDPRMLIVGQARDGQEGVELAQALAPDLVLMDLAMPVMNGLEATRRIKVRPAAPFVLIVSLHKDPAYLRGVRVAQADGFICKSDFAEALPAWLDTWFFGTSENADINTNSLQRGVKK